MPLLLVLFTLLLFTSVSSISKLEDQSFGAPFTDFNSAGSRIIASYREGGHAKVNENFIRLTPDRQSKRGHLWSSRRIDVHDWSVVLEFRVSGQGKTLFGDGLAFWFTDMPNIKNGDVFGVNDDFKGFAVIFDTFRNQEFLSVHKDVSVLTGDGKAGAGDRRNTERPGCDSDFRYYEGADNFDVAKSLSYVKISLKGRKLKVSIDPLANGKFKDCFETANVLPADFDVSKGFFGLTATTGGLADNHDVLTMNAYKLDGQDQEGPDPELHYSKKSDDPLPAHETVGDPNYDPESALRSMISLEKKISKQQVSDVKHYVEHQMSAVKDELKKIIGKVDVKVGEQDKHLSSVDSLVAKIQEEVQTQLANDGIKVCVIQLLCFICIFFLNFFCFSQPPHHHHSLFNNNDNNNEQIIEDKINQLVKVMNGNIELRLKALEKKLDVQTTAMKETIKIATIQHVEKHVAKTMEEKSDDIVQKIMSGSGAWMYAFGLILCIVLCGGGMLWRKIGQGGGSMGILGMRQKKTWVD